MRRWGGATERALDRIAACPGGLVEIAKLPEKFNGKFFPECLANCMLYYEKV